MLTSLRFFSWLFAATGFLALCFPVDSLASPSRSLAKLHKRAKWIAVVDRGSARSGRARKQRIANFTTLQIQENEQVRIRYRAPRKLRRKTTVQLNNQNVRLDRRGYLSFDNSGCGQFQIETQLKNQRRRNLSSTPIGTSFEVQRVDSQGNPSCALSSSAQFRINAGGPEFTDSLGRTWEGDLPFIASGTHYFFENDNEVNGADFGKVGAHERFGSFTYNFPVAPGEYTVRLHFAELFWDRAGERVFDIRVNGDLLADNLDLFEQAGSNTLLTLNYDVSDLDGIISVELSPEENNAQILGLEILAQDGGEESSPSPGPSSNETVGPTPSSTPVPSSSPAPESSSSPSPSPSSAPLDFELRINAGPSGTVVDSLGRSWLSDSAYISEGFNIAFGNSGTTQGAEVPEIFAGERIGDFSYEIPVGSGEFRVRLFMGEMYFTNPGNRVFDVSVEGNLIANDLDLVAAAGHQQAYVITREALVSDGALSISLDPSINYGSIAGIEVIQLSGDPLPSSSPAPSSSAAPSASASPGSSPSSSPQPSPSPTASLTPGELSAVWANNGQDKVIQGDMRATNFGPGSVHNSIWDGTKVAMFGAKNEVVAFNAVLEAGAGNVSISDIRLATLSGPGGFTIQSRPESGNGIFNYVNRQIELFYIRYLEIKGISNLSYDTYDERHVPERMRRPFTGEGYGSGTWYDRPDANTFYPEIAAPLELSLPFTILSGKSQSIWVDIYIPKNAPAGVYTGTLEVDVVGGSNVNVPVELEVLNFSLPDEANSKTMVYLGYADMNRRYIGESYPSGDANEQYINAVRDRHFQVAKRHKISLIDGNQNASAWNTDAPRPEWQSRLDGSLFTSAQGYEGPGESTGNGVFSVGTYGTWDWKDQGEAAMWQRTNNWATWFQNNAPDTEYFLYLIDESSNYAQTNQWAEWINNNPGIGSNMMSFATAQLYNVIPNIPELDIAAGWMASGPTDTWQAGADYLNGTSGKCAYMYNGQRPATGSFATEDDGIALRQLSWAQYKKNICRWFFWESTYYNNFQGGTGQTNVFQSAFTFGGNSGFDSIKGETGWNYSNGDGVLFYPGKDVVFPAESYEIDGPIASTRLKLWRRGIQDVDYIALASSINPGAVQQIVNETVPEVLWEPGVSDPGDPTWVRTDISWSTDPDDWEGKRRQLADIILGAGS